MHIRPLFYISAFVVSLTSASIAWNHLEQRPDASWPIVQGKVVARDSVTELLVLRRPRLHIVVKPNGPSVTAVLMTNASSDIPDDVSFRFDGDPKKEVTLLEEHSAPAVAAALAALAILILALRPLYEREMTKKAKQSRVAGK